MNDKIVNDAVEIAAREGRAPEQSDFMTASVQNYRSMSTEERRALQADLRAAELGTSTESIGGLGDYEEEPYGEDEFEDTALFDEEEEELEPEDEIKSFFVAADCELNWNNYYWAEEEGVIEQKKQALREEHSRECSCGREPHFYIDPA